MATELATAYISLIPELKGAGKSIASQLGGVDVAQTGRKLGKSLSDFPSFRPVGATSTPPSCDAMDLPAPFSSGMSEM